MDDQNETQNAAPATAPQVPQAPVEDAVTQIDPRKELEMLRERCKIMGIPYSNNSKAETLREKINAKLEGDDAAAVEPEEEDEDAVEETDEDAGNNAGVTDLSGLNPGLAPVPAPAPAASVAPVAAVEP